METSGEDTTQWPELSGSLHPDTKTPYELPRTTNGRDESMNVTETSNENKTVIWGACPKVQGFVFAFS